MYCPLPGHPVNVLPSAIPYQLMYHGSELIYTLSNGTTMFQVPVTTQMYACKRLIVLQLPMDRHRRGNEPFFVPGFCPEYGGVNQTAYIFFFSTA